MASPDNGNSYVYDTKAIIRRLKAIRYYKAGNNQSEFARMLDISQSRWNNYETGYPLNLRVCAMLQNVVPHLSIDWIVEGVPHNMPKALAEQLSNIEREIFQTPHHPPRGSGGSRKR